MTDTVMLVAIDLGMEWAVRTLRGVATCNYGHPALNVVR